MGREDEALDAFRSSCEVDSASVASWRLATIALERRSCTLARLALRYLPTSPREMTAMALLHGVSFEDLRRLAGE